MIIKAKAYQEDVSSFIHLFILYIHIIVYNIYICVYEVDDDILNTIYDDDDADDDDIDAIL